MTVHDTHDDMRNLPVMMFIIPLFLWLIAIARAVRWIECSQPSLSDLCFRLISKYAFSYPWRSRMGRKKWGKWIYHNSQRLTAMMGFGKLSIFLHRGRLGFPFGSYSNSHLITPIEIQMTRRHRWDFRVIETYSFCSLGGFTTSRCCRIPSLGFCFFFFIIRDDSISCPKGYTLLEVSRIYWFPWSHFIDNPDDLHLNIFSNGSGIGSSRHTALDPSAFWISLSVPGNANGKCHFISLVIMRLNMQPRIGSIEILSCIICSDAWGIACGRCWCMRHIQIVELHEIRRTEYNRVIAPQLSSILQQSRYENFHSHIAHWDNSCMSCRCQMPSCSATDRARIHHSRILAVFILSFFPFIHQFRLR